VKQIYLFLLLNFHTLIKSLSKDSGIEGRILKSWLTRFKQTTGNTTFMYNLRMIIAFAGTAFVPYLMGQQLMTIPLTLGVVAAGLGF
jgi:hypothetical protein